jgi:hypothetical protein
MRGNPYELGIKLFQRPLFDFWRIFFSKGDFGFSMIN